MNIKEITTSKELEHCFPVIKELRGHLTLSEFTSLFESAKKTNGYTLLGVYEKDHCVALMGYRILHDFVHGKHLYIDDLVVTESKRSSGMGAKLLKHAEGLAKELKCKGLRLCTGVENKAGIKFYEREGWNPRALAFKKSLDAY